MLGAVWKCLLDSFELFSYFIQKFWILTYKPLNGDYSLININIVYISGYVQIHVFQTSANSGSSPLVDTQKIVIMLLTVTTVFVITTLPLTIYYIGK